MNCGNYRTFSDYTAACSGFCSYGALMPHTERRSHPTATKAWSVPHRRAMLGDIEPFQASVSALMGLGVVRPDRKLPPTVWTMRQKLSAS